MAVGLCAALLAALGSARADYGDDVPRQGSAIGLGASSAGNFLAARHAHVRHDFRGAADYLQAALKESPGDPELVKRALAAFLVDGRFDSAAAIAEHVLSVKADDPFARLTLYVNALKNQRTADAERHLAALPDTGVTLALRGPLQAWTLYAAGRREEAMAKLQSFIDRHQGDEHHRLHLALMNDLSGNTDAALRAYRPEGGEAKGRSLRNVELVGNFLERQGRRSEAAELYRANVDGQGTMLGVALARAEAGGAPPAPIVRSATDGAAEALFNVAAALARQNGQENALALARLGLALRPDFALLKIVAAQLLESFDRYEEANRLYMPLVSSPEIGWQTRLGIAANLSRLGRFDEATAMLKEMAAERPSDPEPFIELGDMLRGREQFREAVNAYDAAFARIPAIEKRHWVQLYSRGIALERSKMWDRAEADLLKALEFQPDQPLVLNYLGYSWVEQGRHLERAMEMIRKAVELRPSDGYIVDSLGWAHYQLGSYPEAVRELERAVELRPQDPVINDHLGDAYWMVGREREARFQWQAALGLDPEADLKSQIEEKLARGLIRTARRDQ